MTATAPRSSAKYKMLHESIEILVLECLSLRVAVAVALSIAP
jgi:hypothetical protein